MRYIDKISLFALFLLWALETESFGASISPGLKQDLAQMVTNLMKELGGQNGPFFTFFLALMIIIGLILVGVGIVGLTRQDTPKGGAIATIIVGTALIGFEKTLDVLTMSVFEEQSHAAIVSEATGEGSSKLTETAKMFISFAVFMVQVVGCCALYRGLKTIADVSLTRQRQPEMMRAAWIFIVMGVICINIVWTLQLLANTMGTEGQKYFDMLLGHVK